MGHCEDKPQTGSQKNEKNSSAQRVVAATCPTQTAMREVTGEGSTNLARGDFLLQECQRNENDRQLSHLTVMYLHARKGRGDVCAHLLRRRWCRAAVLRVRSSNCPLVSFAATTAARACSPSLLSAFGLRAAVDDHIQWINGVRTVESRGRFSFLGIIGERSKLMRREATHMAKAACEAGTVALVGTEVSSMASSACEAVVMAHMGQK